MRSCLHPKKVYHPFWDTSDRVMPHILGYKTMSTIIAPNPTIIADLQLKIGRWAEANFGNNESQMTEGLTLGSLAPLLGIFEEFGEYASACVERNALPMNDKLLAQYESGEKEPKSSDLVAAYKKRRDEVFDAIGDMGVYLCDYATREGIELASLLPREFNAGFDVMDLLPDVFLGKLCHATLKAHQGIREFKNPLHYAQVRDANVRGFTLYLYNLAHNEGQDFEQILTRTWNNVVRKRNWKKHPLDGVTPAADDFRPGLDEVG